MARQISPLAIRIVASGSQEVQSEIRKTAGAFEIVVSSAAKAERGAAATGRETIRAARAMRENSAAINDVNTNAVKTQKSVADVAREVRSTARDFVDMAQSARAAASAALKTYEVIKALKSGGPVALFNAAVPEHVQRKIGMGMVAGGVGLSLGLGTTIKPAMEKQSRLTAIEAITKSPRAAGEIYEQTDEASTASVFSLSELVVASKTLTKDSQFSKELLRAVDDLAAVNRDEGATPQDVARALGRIKAGDYGEGFERLRDFGISKKELEAQGLKFDKGGSYESDAPDAAKKAIDAVVKIIQQRFNGLSEELATTTLEGSLSNMGDAIGRLQTSIGEAFIPALNFGANTIRILVSAINALPTPVKQGIAWIAALGGGVLILGGAFLMVAGTIAKVVFAVKAANFVLGLFGTSLGKLALTMLTKAIPATLAMGLTMLGLVAAVGLLIYVSKMYWDELQRGTKTVEDARTAEQKRNDEKSADAVRDAVRESESLSDRDRYSVLKAAIKKAGELGDTDLADEIEKERLPLAKKLRKSGVDTGNAAAAAVSDAGNALVSKINAQAAGNKAARLSAVDYLPKQSDSGPSLAELQNGDWLKAFQNKTMPDAAKAGAVGGIGIGGLSGPLSVGIAEAQLRAGESADVQQQQQIVDALQSEIYALQDKKRSASKEEKAQIAATLVEKQRALSAAKRELAARKKLSGQAQRAATREEKEAEKLAKEQEERKINIYQANSEVESAMESARFNEQIEALEDELETAREEANAAKVRALVLQIGRLRAEREYSEEIARADAIGHENEIDADKTARLAKIKRDDALRRARRDAEKAFKQTEKSGGGKDSAQLRDAQTRALLAMQSAVLGGGEGGFSALGAGINYGDRFAGMAPSLWGAGSVPATSEFLAEQNRAMDAERKARVGSMKQDSRGKITISFEEIELPYNGVGALRGGLR